MITHLPENMHSLFFFFTYHGKDILLFIYKDLGVATQFYKISRFILKALLTTGDSLFLCSLQMSG